MLLGLNTFSPANLLFAALAFDLAFLDRRSSRQATHDRVLRPSREVKWASGAAWPPEQNRMPGYNHVSNVPCSSSSFAYRHFRYLPLQHTKTDLIPPVSAILTEPVQLARGLELGFWDPWNSNVVPIGAALHARVQILLGHRFICSDCSVQRPFLCPIRPTRFAKAGCFAVSSYELGFGKPRIACMIRV